VYDDDNDAITSIAVRCYSVVHMYECNRAK